MFDDIDGDDDESQDYVDNPEEVAAVKKGARLLDKILPGWHRQINLDHLQMDSGVHCMMGQLFGAGVEAQLAREMYPEEMSKLRSADGFRNALCQHYWQDGNHVEDLITRLMRKLRLKAGYAELDRVCAGHDNRCVWSAEVAERIAADETSSKGGRHVKR